jgi:polar amino acid transport system substrate-binding protein
MKRMMRLLALIAAMSLVLAACGDDGEDGGEGTDAADLGLVADGTLTVCTDVPFPPMEFEDAEEESGYNGFDIELMAAIADDLGLGIAVVTPGFDAITSGLAMESGDCDISAASITITEEREQGVDFSEPYFTADQSLLVKADSGITELAGLDGLAVAVQTGTTGAAYAEENAEANGYEVVSFDDAAGPYLALNAGDVAGVLTDIVGNQGVADEDDTVTVVETYATDESYGLAVKEEGSEALLEAVNASLAQFEEDGTYDEIYASWFPES